MDFNGKRILITGSTRGIGKVLAHRFVQGGASVCPGRCERLHQWT